ncbi:hypothetical protein [Ferrovibrio terrae]|uniref:hypothetical protein n=1 Tax=Ferrovibrio terrae TaxID=2594003 RepID=UPI003137F395
MPIKPENRSRYPADWPQIAQAIKDGARWRCQKCGVKHAALGGRDADGLWYSAGSIDCSGRMPARGTEAWCYRDGHRPMHLRIVQIIITVAHLDHQPENCDPENLRAWCQRCHNLYDQAHRRRNAAATIRSRKAAGDLFGEDASCSPMTN